MSIALLPVGAQNMYCSHVDGLCVGMFGVCLSFIGCFIGSVDHGHCICMSSVYCVILDRGMWECHFSCSESVGRVLCVYFNINLLDT